MSAKDLAQGARLPSANSPEAPSHGLKGLETSTTHGARDHARAQGGTVVEAMPTLPASAWPAPPDGVAASDLTWAEVVAGGNYTNKVVARGTTIRLTDLSGDACAHVLLFNADQPWERLNVADTVKVPWQAYLGAGHPLLSDQGRVLATLVDDSSGAPRRALRDDVARRPTRRATATARRKGRRRPAASC